MLKLRSFPLVDLLLLGGPIILQGARTCRFANSFNDPRGPGQGVGLRPHGGIDIVAAPGTLVIAPHAGTVEWAGWSPLSGWAVTVRSSGKRTHRAYHALYAHLLEPPLVSKGDTITPFTPLGHVGATGGHVTATRGSSHTIPHLHFAIRADHQPVNPYRQLDILAPLPKPTPKGWRSTERFVPHLDAQTLQMVVARLGAAKKATA